MFVFTNHFFQQLGIATKFYTKPNLENNNRKQVYFISSENSLHYIFEGWVKGR